MLRVRCPSTPYLAETDTEKTVKTAKQQDERTLPTHLSRINVAIRRERHRRVVCVHDLAGARADDRRIEVVAPWYLDGELAKRLQVTDGTIDIAPER